MRWNLKPQPGQEKVKHLTKRLGISNTLAYLLALRGIETYEQAKAFFNPNLEDLHDPFLMKDMDLAVKRIEKAIAQNENILVYGDYDVDGTSSVALMATFLQEYTDNVATYIPDRYLEGYGISLQGIDFAHDNDISLIIALDCGIKAINQIEYAKEKNIDFIICDHHLPDTKIPQAAAVLNPKQINCSYPYKELCGCGVGFKLIQAITQNRGESFEKLIPYLDLVATAIGADIVPITGENRILTFHGLEVINSSPRPGLKAIINQTNKTEFTINDVVFIIAPRINAAGRIKHGLRAVDLLMEKDYKTAENFAQKIEEFNNDRRKIDKSITAEALLQIQKSGTHKNFTTVVYNHQWHKGVIGIVASRLIETYYRPTLVFTKSGDRLAASARSISGFNIYQALEACSEHIDQFGGHKYAAGLTLQESKFEVFKEKFEEVVSSTLKKNLLRPEIVIDKTIEFSEINASFYRTIQRFAPFGPGNMKPVFLTKNIQDTGFARQVGQEEKHLKCCLRDPHLPTGVGIDAIGFDLGEKIQVIKNNSSFEAVYSLDENRWNNRNKIQLNLKDIR